jgi:hypothetical protein
MTNHLMMSILAVLGGTALGAAIKVCYPIFVRPWIRTQVTRVISAARGRPACRHLELTATFTSAHQATRSKLNELKTMCLPHRPIFESGIRVETRAQMPSAKVAGEHDVPLEERIADATDVWDVALEIPEAEHLFGPIPAPLLICDLPGLEYACLGAERVLDTVTSASDAAHAVLKDLKTHLLGLKFSYIVPLFKQWRLLSQHKTTALKATVQSIVGVAAIAIFSTVGQILGAIVGAAVGEPAAGMVAGGVVGTRFGLWIVKAVNYLRLRWRSSRLNRYVKVANVQVEDTTSLAVERCESLRVAANSRWEEAEKRAVQYGNENASSLLREYQDLCKAFSHHLIGTLQGAASTTVVWSAIRGLRGRLDWQQRLALLVSPRCRTLLLRIAHSRAARILKILDRCWTEKESDGALESILIWLASNPVASQSTVALIENCHPRVIAFKDQALLVALRMTRHLIKCRQFLSRRVERAESLAQRQLAGRIQEIQTRYDTHRRALQELADSVGHTIVFSRN